MLLLLVEGKVYTLQNVRQDIQCSPSFCHQAQCDTETVNGSASMCSLLPFLFLTKPRFCPGTNPTWWGLEEMAPNWSKILVLLVLFFLPKIDQYRHQYMTYIWKGFWKMFLYSAPENCCQHHTTHLRERSRDRERSITELLGEGETESWRTILVSTLPMDVFVCEI